MSISINNQKDIIANSISIIQSNGSVKDINNIITEQIGTVEGNLSPEQINTISALSSALNNDPNYFNTINNELSQKSNINNPTFTGTVNGITKSMVGLSNVDNTSDVNKPISSATQAGLDLKSNINNPTFTGTVNGISKAMVGLGEVDNTSDLNKPISVAAGVALALKAPVNSPTFTGTVNGITKAMVGLGEVDNTSDANKPISTATQAALDLKTNQSDFVALIGGAPEALNTLNELAAALNDDENFASTITNQIALKSNINNPTFTGTVNGITKSMVGLSNVDNTSDVNKPISSATQAALDLKSNINNPTFTGTVNGISKAMVGLSNVDNTSDVNKPISTATQAALDLKTNTSTTNNSAVAWSSGLSSDSQHKLKTGTDNILIENQTNAPVAAFFNAGNTSIYGQLFLSQGITFSSLGNQTFNDILAGKVNYILNVPLALYEAKADLIGADTQAFVKFVNDVTISGTCNITTNLVVDGTNILDALDLKADISSVMVKEISGTNVIWGLDNKFRVQTSNDNNFRLQVYDDSGAIITDSWLDVLQINFNTDTNKPTLYITNLESNDISGNIFINDNVVNNGNVAFNGSVTGLDKTSVGLNNIDNTSDLNKPVSTATQAALDLKENNITVTKNGASVDLMTGTNHLKALISPDNSINITEDFGNYHIQLQANNTYVNSQLALKQNNLIFNSPAASVPISTDNLNVKAIKPGNNVILSTDSNSITVDVKPSGFSISDAIITGAGQIGTVYTNTILKASGNEITIGGDVAIGTALLVDSIRTSYASEIAITDNVNITGNLTVSGNVNINEHNPFWVAGYVNGSGTPSITYQYGQQTATVARESGYGTGVFRITMPAHPLGAQYIVQLTNNYFGWCRVFETIAHTSTYFVVSCLNNTGSGLLDGKFFFTVIGPVPATTQNSPFYCCGRVAANGTKVSDKGKFTYTVSKTGTGVYAITFGTAAPSNDYVVNVTTLAYTAGNPNHASILGGSLTTSGFSVINQYSDGTNHSIEFDQDFQFSVYV